MLPATTLLVVIGSLSIALSVEIVNKRSGEHLISLRDYDFVGEDARLARALTARLAVLQAPLQAQPPPPPPPRRPPAPPLRRDLLPLSLRGYPRQPSFTSSYYSLHISNQKNAGQLETTRFFGAIARYDNKNNCTG
ncbi:uncharacterized protein LOC110380152 isoform X2 [Helicoverpa armigera]|uniref:uncharacterized protein LOC110380152 isoform X2 n=1 Tax=Helicoverpa armigera TaxID=29058 RepID=UPI0030838E6E